jgi:hypothetical protein
MPKTERGGRSRWIDCTNTLHGKAHCEEDQVYVGSVEILEYITRPREAVNLSHHSPNVVSPTLLTLQTCASSFV